jgi:prepilin-type N-terminal cleavage/methylation domain-containing protein
MGKRAQATLGMTIVELMIVVVIIGILAAISAVGYRKYIGRARLSEANAMLAEFAAKEQLYFLDNGQYMEAHNDSVAPQDPTSQSEEASEFWPQTPNPSDPRAFDSARTPVAIYDSNGNMPISWRRLGIRPRWQALYCTYMVNAGAPGSRLPGTVGPTLWPAAPQVPWFYAMAVCNLSGDAGWPNTAGAIKVTVLVLTHDSPALRTTDENQ